MVADLRRTLGAEVARIGGRIEADGAIVLPDAVLFERGQARITRADAGLPRGGLQALARRADALRGAGRGREDRGARLERVAPRELAGRGLRSPTSTARSAARRPC